MSCLELLEAIRLGDAKEVESLVARASDGNSTAWDTGKDRFNTPQMDLVRGLQRASLQGDLNACRILCERGQAYTPEYSRSMTLKLFFRSHNPLVAAAKMGHVDLVRYYLKDCKIHPDEVDGEKKTGLQWARQRGHLEVCRVLVEQGADPYFGGSGCGGLLLYAAIRRGNVDLIRTLVRCGGVDPDNGMKPLKPGERSFNQTPLDVALFAGQVSALEALLEEGAVALSVDSRFMPAGPALFSSRGGAQAQEETRKLFVKLATTLESSDPRRKFAADFIDASFRSALSFSMPNKSRNPNNSNKIMNSSRGNRPTIPVPAGFYHRCCRKLLEAGINVHSQNDKGQSLLHHALQLLSSQNGSDCQAPTEVFQICIALLEHGLLPTHQNLSQLLFRASCLEDEAILQSILQFWANRHPGGRDPQGDTALHVVCRNPQATLQAVQIALRQNPQSIDACDTQQGFIPIQSACLCSQGKLDVAYYLLRQKPNLLNRSSSSSKSSSKRSSCTTSLEEVDLLVNRLAKKQKV